LERRLPGAYSRFDDVHPVHGVAKSRVDSIGVSRSSATERHQPPKPPTAKNVNERVPPNRLMLLVALGLVVAAGINRRVGQSARITAV
jgi:hypothetical protein